MSRERPQRAGWIGNNLLVIASVGKGQGKIARLRMLVDTGASFTMIPPETLVKLGYLIHKPLRKERLISANGIVVAPIIKVAWFNCLGQVAKNFEVAAHSIGSSRFDGILGMDFLTEFRALISVETAEIHCRQPKHKQVRQ